MDELTGLEVEPEVAGETHAAWPLVLALSNRSEALLKLARHEAVLEDVTSAHVLLERYRASFDDADVTRIVQKLSRREAEAGTAIEVQQHREQRAQTELQRDAERRSARAERRRRARDAARAEAARNAREAADEVDALAEALAGAQIEQRSAEPEECLICQEEGTTDQPLEDVCGHDHRLHAGCASRWRVECFRLQMAEPERHSGPHCPMCRRPI